MINFVRRLSDGTTIYLITIYENEIVKEVDGVTRKYTDAVEKEKSESRADTISSDHEENLDGGLLTRYVNKWDAELRSKLRFCLWSQEIVSADDNEPEKPARKYLIKRKPGDESGDAIQSAEALIHNYLVSGALYEWYRSMNVQLADSYFVDAENLKNEIVSMLRGKPRGARPLQPFGPPFPTTPLF